MNNYRLRIFLSQYYGEMVNFVKNFPRLYYCLRTIKRFKDIEYIKMVNSMGKRADILQWRCYGKINQGKNFLLIEMSPVTIGMGAIIRHMILGFYFADKLNCLPVVVWSKKNPYQEEDVFLNTDNAFEYYFSQPRNVLLKEVYKSDSVIIFNDINLWLGHEGLGDPNQEMLASYEVSEKYLIAAGNLVSKYLNLNSYTYDFIHENKRKIFLNANKILGVHIRGTDFNLHWKFHPNIVDVETYFSAIDEALCKDFSTIFLATDDSRLLSLFKERYNDKLLYFTDTHREEGEINVSFVDSRREHGHYLNGLEVLRDIYVLAECDGLIAGLSHVSFCARIIRYSLGKKFEYQKILDNGIYKG